MRYHVSDIRYEVSFMSFHVSGIRYQDSGMRYHVSGINYQLSAIRYQRWRIGSAESGVTSDGTIPPPPPPSPVCARPFTKTSAWRPSRSRSRCHLCLCRRGQRRRRRRRTVCDSCDVIDALTCVNDTAACVRSGRCAGGFAR